MSFSILPSFRSAIASSSRTTLPSLSSCSFSTTPVSLASRERKNRVKRKKERNLALRAARAAESESERPDPVFGHVVRSDAPSPWETCRLRRVILRPEDVYNTPLTQYPTGEQPRHFLPGLSTEDRDLLFGALPHVSVEVKSDLERLDSVSESGKSRAQEEEEGKMEQMMRLLDLRNANKAGIEAVNRQRVIEEFGRREDGKGLDTGSTEVQAALLTHKIRGLAEHLASNAKDNSNKRALRTLVHKRQQLLKYFARKEPERYEPLLADLGLEKRAVEGEITM